MSVVRCHRLWYKAGLQVPRKRPRKRVAVSRPKPLTPSMRNQVWAYDFVFDACAKGPKLKCRTIIDEYTRECLAIDVAGSIRSARVVDVLSRLINQHGAPQIIRSDNGPEFVSRAVLQESTTPRSIRRTANPASHGRPARTRVSTASYVTNVCRWSGSAPAPKPGSSSKHGVVITTPSARIQALATQHQTGTKPLSAATTNRRPDSLNQWSDKGRQVNTITSHPSSP